MSLDPIVEELAGCGVDFYGEGSFRYAPLLFRTGSLCLLATKLSGMRFRAETVVWKLECSGLIEGAVDKRIGV